MKYIVVHYGEIGIKGKNRRFFENTLINNIKRLVRGKGKVRRMYGRILIETDKMDEKIFEILALTPGIEYFAPAVRADLSLDSIIKSTLDLAKSIDFKTFKISTTRSYKAFPFTSMQVNAIVGEEIVKGLKKKVDLSSPDITFFIEICEGGCFIYTKKYRGVGGLPVGTTGNVVCLLSGGIDSPVAAFMMMRRGCKVTLVHFYNQRIIAPATLSKIKKIAERLSNFQHPLELILVPFADIQRAIIQNIPSKYRMIVYRRFMMRIAQKIAEKKGAVALTTGDNVGQVASQTLENLRCIYDVVSIPVLPPLIGMNKMEIVDWAKRIGTYNISILPYQDCCSFMVAKHPATKADPMFIESLEKNLAMDDLINSSLSKIKTFVY